MIAEKFYRAYRLVESHVEIHKLSHNRLTTTHTTPMRIIARFVETVATSCVVIIAHVYSILVVMFRRYYTHHRKCLYVCLHTFVCVYVCLRLVTHALAVIQNIRARAPLPLWPHCVCFKVFLSFLPLFKRCRQQTLMLQLLI